MAPPARFLLEATLDAGAALRACEEPEATSDFDDELVAFEADALHP